MGDARGRCWAANLGGKDVVAESTGDRTLAATRSSCDGEGGGPWQRWGTAVAGREADLGGDESGGDGEGGGH